MAAPDIPERSEIPAPGVESRRMDIHRGAADRKLSPPPTPAATIGRYLSGRRHRQPCPRQSDLREPENGQIFPDAFNAALSGYSRGNHRI
ncbi:hypothetical protein D2T29_14620 [Sinirhodobacter populi]|uniref:Uncharacterized protein n=1 Tax=Paenirhodobacter populi TaxID=2306993 RepID=A0A443K901_9RHOB|nr:hypothetical protein [Sinirhodobacter populi]RWR29277.1 hypothetical protein D2T29_14620 [Sinirhodobacter populi]